jgi:hypothetical protein
MQSSGHRVKSSSREHWRIQHGPSVGTRAEESEPVLMLAIRVVEREGRRCIGPKPSARDFGASAARRSQESSPHLRACISLRAGNEIAPFSRVFPFSLKKRFSDSSKAGRVGSTWKQILRPEPAPATIRPLTTSFCPVDVDPWPVSATKSIQCVVQRCRCGFLPELLSDAAFEEDIERSRSGTASPRASNLRDQFP